MPGGIVQDVVLQVGHRLAVLILRHNGEQSEGAIPHCTEHLAAVQAGHHPVQLSALRRLPRLGKGRPRHLIEKHPVGVEGVVHSRQVELGLRHQGGHGGVNLQHRPQLLAREVAGDQRRPGGPVGPGPHIQHIKDLGRGDISPGQRRPQHPVRREGDQGLSLRQPGNGLGRPGKGVRRQLSQAVSILNPRLGQWEEKVASGQHLVIGEAIGAQIADVHLLLPVPGQSGNLRVLPRRPVNGDQAVLLQGLLPRPVPGQGDAPQVFTVGPGGDNVGVPHHNGFRQGGVGMSRNDQVDLRHRPGQVLIL